MTAQELGGLVAALRRAREASRDASRAEIEADAALKQAMRAKILPTGRDGGKAVCELPSGERLLVVLCRDANGFERLSLEDLL